MFDQLTELMRPKSQAEGIKEAGEKVADGLESRQKGKIRSQEKATWLTNVS